MGFMAYQEEQEKPIRLPLPSKPSGQKRTHETNQTDESNKQREVNAEPPAEIANRVASASALLVPVKSVKKVALAPPPLALASLQTIKFIINHTQGLTKSSGTSFVKACELLQQTPQVAFEQRHDLIDPFLENHFYKTNNQPEVLTYHIGPVGAKALFGLIFHEKNLKAFPEMAICCYDELLYKISAKKTSTDFVLETAIYTRVQHLLNFLVKIGPRIDQHRVKGADEKP